MVGLQINVEDFIDWREDLSEIAVSGVSHSH